MKDNQEQSEDLKEIRSRTKEVCSDNQKDDRNIYYILKKNKVILSVGIIAAIAVVAFIIVVLNKNTIELSDYVTVSYYGANGYAGADCVVDSEKLYESLAKNEKDMAKLTIYRTLADSVSASSDQQNISNGTIVPVVVTYDEAAAEQAGVKVAKSHYNVRASGVNTGIKIDLYEKIAVTFAGVSPDAYIMIDNQWDDDYLKSLSFTADHYSSIQKDDTVTLSCNTEWEEIARHGYIVTKMQAEYKADELSTYAQTVADLDLDVLQTIKKEAEETIISETESTVFRMLYKATKDSTYLYEANDEHAEQIGQKEMYFLTRKDNIAGGMDNYLYVFYQAEISNDSTSMTVYFAFEYTQGYLNKNGQFNIAHDQPQTRYTTYTSYDEMYDTLIKQKESTYDINQVTK